MADAINTPMPSALLITGMPAGIAVDPSDRIDTALVLYVAHAGGGLAGMVVHSAGPCRLWRVERNMGILCFPEPQAMCMGVCPDGELADGFLLEVPGTDGKVLQVLCEMPGGKMIEYTVPDGESISRLRTEAQLQVAPIVQQRGNFWPFPKSTPSDTNLWKREPDTRDWRVHATVSPRVGRGIRMICTFRAHASMRSLAEFRAKGVLHSHGFAVESLLVEPKIDS